MVPLCCWGCAKIPGPTWSLEKVLVCQICPQNSDKNCALSASRGLCHKLCSARARLGLQAEIFGISSAGGTWRVPDCPARELWGRGFHREVRNQVSLGLRWGFSSEKVNFAVRRFSLGPQSKFLTSVRFDKCGLDSL